MAQPRRVYRVAEKVRSVIANQLIRSGDARFHMVTVSAVAVSPDLRHAKVYWFVTGGKNRVPEVEEAFEHAAPHLRRDVAKELNIRFTPVLKFYYDDTLDTVEEVEKLFAKIPKLS